MKNWYRGKYTMLSDLLGWMSQKLTDDLGKDHSMVIILTACTTVRNYPYQALKNRRNYIPGNVINSFTPRYITSTTTKSQNGL